jgi:enamine deaminase RidA (YjgF/YER057c/UK114 family)
MIERILVPGIMEPVSHYCHVVRAGPHVWVSGVAGLDGNGDVPEGVVAQFDLAIDVMDQCLKAAGAGADHVVKVQVFLTDINDRPPDRLFRRPPPGIDARRGLRSGRSAPEG